MLQIKQGFLEDSDLETWIGWRFWFKHMDWLKILIKTYGLVEDSDSNIWIGWRFWFKHMDWLNRYICFSTVLCGLLFSIWGMTNDISRKGQFFLENSFPNLLLMKLRTLSKCQSLIFSSRPFFHYSLNFSTSLSFSQTHLLLFQLTYFKWL